jgi:succinyl-diaminopimelate desuccinylase
VHQTLAISYYGFVLSKAASPRAGHRQNLHPPGCAGSCFDNLDVVQNSQDLVRFRTINPPGDERACAERLASLLEMQASQSTSFRSAKAGRSLSPASAAPTKTGDRFHWASRYCALGAQLWTVDPLAADIKDGKLYGWLVRHESGVAAFVTACAALGGKLANTPGGPVHHGRRETVARALRLWRAETPLPRVGALVVSEPTGAAHRWSQGRAMA